MPLWALAGALVAVWPCCWPAPGARATRADPGRHRRRRAHSLEKEPLPSAAAKAYEAILPSVVRVVGLMDDNDTGEDNPEERAMQRSLGTGVVIIDNGTILTNLHVVSGAKKVRVRFANGHESEAVMTGAQPENDLAVLKAQSLPDDLEAATMRSTADLRPGDHVIAVGNPFGIGPSVSYGVVSGLKREFRARRRKDAHQPDPVRRRRQPGQQRRPAGHDGRPGGGHRHRHPQPFRAAHLHRHRLCRAD
jgi:S1-C subfamily serine protease